MTNEQSRVSAYESTSQTPRHEKLLFYEEAQEFAARLPEIRAAFGNPFFYGHPENADESVANYTGSSSHEVVLPTVLALRSIDRELRRIRKRLLELGVSTDEFETNPL